MLRHNSVQIARSPVADSAQYGLSTAEKRPKRGLLQVKIPDSGPVYCVEFPRLVQLTPNFGASASHMSLKGRLPLPVAGSCTGSEPPVTFRYVPPFTPVFLPPKMRSGMLFWL